VITGLAKPGINILVLYSHLRYHYRFISAGGQQDNESLVIGDGGREHALA